MLTKSDLEELEKRFVTKEEFSRTMNDVVELIQTTADSVIKEIKMEIRSFRDEFRKEISDLRTEVNEFRVEIRMGMANHEKRINKLEEKNYS